MKKDEVELVGKVLRIDEDGLLVQKQDGKEKRIPIRDEEERAA